VPFSNNKNREPSLEICYRPITRAFKKGSTKNSSKARPIAPLPERRFPLPRTVEELDACLVVIDSARPAYFEDEAQRKK